MMAGRGWPRGRRLLLLAAPLILSWALYRHALGRRLAAAEESLAPAAAAVEAAIARAEGAGRNPSAEPLEGLAAAVGIDLARHARPADGDSTELKQTREQLKAWIEQQFHRPDPVLAPPPPAVAAWLAARRSDLERLVEHLRTAPVPTWPYDRLASEAVEADQVLALGGTLHLQRALVGHALAAAIGGDAAGARAGLEAAHAWAQALAARPEVICRLLAIASARIELGALLRLEDADPSWLARHPTPAMAEAIAESYRIQAWRQGELARHGSGAAVRREIGIVDGDLSRGQRVVWRAITPALRYLQADTAGWLPSEVDDLHGYAGCEADPEVLADEFFADPPYRKVAEPSFPAAPLARGTRLDLEAELAREVLAARAAQATCAGACPEGEREVPSRACEGSAWLVSTTADGGFAIELSDPPLWTPTIGLALPLAWRE